MVKPVHVLWHADSKPKKFALFVRRLRPFYRTLVDRSRLCDNAAQFGRLALRTRHRQSLCIVLVCIFLFCLAASARTARKRRSTGAPAFDKAYLQTIWDGWERLDPSKQAQFYAKGTHTFFDVAPLKYTSWSEYQAGVAKELADYKSAKFTVNNDAEIHPCGPEYAWAAATVKQDAVMKSGRHDLATFRWTAVFQHQGGRWLMVHEHVSTPQP